MVDDDETSPPSSSSRRSVNTTCVPLENVSRANACNSLGNTGNPLEFFTNASTLRNTTPTRSPIHRINSARDFGAPVTCNATYTFARCSHAALVSAHARYASSSIFESPVTFVRSHTLVCVNASTFAITDCAKRETSPSSSGVKRAHTACAPTCPAHRNSLSNFFLASAPRSDSRSTPRDVRKTTRVDHSVDVNSSSECAHGVVESSSTSSTTAAG